MKKLSEKQRARDRQTGLAHRKGILARKNRAQANANRKATQYLIDEAKDMGIELFVEGNRHVTIYLPEKMNFHDDYEKTVLNFTAIRALSSQITDPLYKDYKLRSVNLDNLREISSSAALVLTAELSKWDDAIRQKLRPKTARWDKSIFKKFKDLGFFDLFQKTAFDENIGDDADDGVSLVQYIKGRCGDNDKPRLLKDQIIGVVGDEVKKWMFLHGGLTEAITNVSHHAYPIDAGFNYNDRNWYLTGSYNDETNELKIIFYDQGIGIPASLPASNIWESVLQYMSKHVDELDRKKDEVLLKAAVEMGRTRTEQEDRGKGLQDLLEFIRQRQDGYLSIMSARGLYKMSVNNGTETLKTERFNNPIGGTLIIWCVTLQDK